MMAASKLPMPGEKTMRTMAACLCITALAALPSPAQNAKPAATPPAAGVNTAVPAAAPSACPECGIVRSIRPVVKETKPLPGSEVKPSGLVASIPLDGGKPQVKSSTKIGKDAVVSGTTWEVVVLLDDGRFRVVTTDERGDWKEGDRVRIDGGRLLSRID